MTCEEHRTWHRTALLADLTVQSISTPDTAPILPGQTTSHPHEPHRIPRAPDTAPLSRKGVRGWWQVRGGGPGACRYCGDPSWMTDAEDFVHPCCEFWIGRRADRSAWPAELRSGWDIGCHSHLSQWIRRRLGGAQRLSRVQGVQSPKFPHRTRPLIRYHRVTAGHETPGQSTGAGSESRLDW